MIWGFISTENIIGFLFYAVVLAIFSIVIIYERDKFACISRTGVVYFWFTLFASFYCLMFTLFCYFYQTIESQTQREIHILNLNAIAVYYNIPQ